MKKKIISPEYIQVLYSNFEWFMRAFDLPFEEIVKQVRKHHKRMVNNVK